jgi:hypothetical protein
MNRKYWKTQNYESSYGSTRDRGGKVERKKKANQTLERSKKVAGRAYGMSLSL